MTGKRESLGLPKPTHMIRTVPTVSAMQPVQETVSTATEDSPLKHVSMSSTIALHGAISLNTLFGSNTVFVKTTPKVEHPFVRAEPEPTAVTKIHDPDKDSLIFRIRKQREKAGQKS